MVLSPADLYVKWRSELRHLELLSESAAHVEKLVRSHEMHQ
jgi:hypothetical protein